MTRNNKKYTIKKIKVRKGKKHMIKKVRHVSFDTVKIERLYRHGNTGSKSERQSKIDIRNKGHPLIA